MSSKNSVDIDFLRKSHLGQESPPTTLVIEKSQLTRFADAIEDPNPLWTDELQARKSQFGGLIAPPTFLRVLRTERLEELPNTKGLDRLLDGGSTWEYMEPVRVGDRITAINRVVDIYDRKGRLGQMVFIVTQTTYSNQFEQVVATQQNTSIRY